MTDSFSFLPKIDDDLKWFYKSDRDTNEHHTPSITLKKYSSWSILGKRTRLSSRIDGIARQVDVIISMGKIDHVKSENLFNDLFS